MDEEQMKKEHEEILAEIAEGNKGKDEPSDKTSDEEDEGEGEPGDTTESDTTEDEDDKSKADEEDDEDDKGEDDEEDEDDKSDSKRQPNSRRIPLSKYQDLKNSSRETIKQKDAEIAELRDKLAKGTVSQVEQGVKEYAEKHNIPAEQVIDLVKLFKGESALTDSQKIILEKADKIIQQGEAQASFETEFSELIKDVPDAANHKAAIMKEAYKEGNLNRSLYEIFHRSVKDKIVPKKKTGETSRGTSSTRTSTPAFDVAKVAEKIKTNAPGALDGLSGEQQDQVFAYMEKHGSRFSK